ncbi:hypothetical protein Purlil1_3189 [Purpureocillium lilacinum]|uniref:Uncharacterized protein n=1 Tax=Purpureocillium lilacinum TaxID=33203 RepID=A0ABR0CA28_PURLI|nr:hypothetical protein Purlil1_3189 [Purpureocillium lilacinum]
MTTVEEGKEKNDKQDEFVEVEGAEASREEKGVTAGDLASGRHALAALLYSTAACRAWRKGEGAERRAATGRRTNGRKKERGAMGTKMERKEDGQDRVVSVVVVVLEEVDADVEVERTGGKGSWEGAHSGRRWARKVAWSDFALCLGRELLLDLVLGAET